MTAKPCKHPRLDKQLRCKSCGLLVDIREKKNKYGAKRTDGFHSAKEARRFQILKVQEKAGLISGLECQKRIQLIPAQDGEKEAYWKADFVYIECRSGEEIWEDTKGYRTPLYILKRKLALFVHGKHIRET